MTPGLALVGGKGGILKVVYSLGVDGLLEIGLGDRNPELGRGVNG